MGRVPADCTLKHLICESVCASVSLIIIWTEQIVAFVLYGMKHKNANGLLEFVTAL